jgi:hypothetical protein
MFQGIRSFLKIYRRGIGAGIVLVGITALLLTLFPPFGGSVAATMSQDRRFVCIETGKTFELEIKPGMKNPVRSPYTGRNTGYEVQEVCTWTADGKVAGEPTYIVMNPTLGKPGPTFCPTCNRLVVDNNPPAEPGAQPPPLK